MREINEATDELVVSAVKEYMQLLETGEAPSPREYADQFPQCKDELLPALEGLMMVHKADGERAADAKAASEFTAKPLGDFQILGEIGRGGMGVVYEAVQLSLGRRVALKVLPFASGLDEVRLQRFHNEAHAAAALHHTNIVPVYAVGTERGVHYYAMQLIEGQTLEEVIAEVRDTDQIDKLKAESPADAKSHLSSTIADSSLAGRRSTASFPRSTYLSSSASERQRYLRWAVSLIRDAARALDHAHRYGVIHRDIKPSNLILDSTGKVWLTDFGLAQIESESLNLTNSGDPIGTLRYMSPEQATGNRSILDHRTDIYSLAATFYELLTLRPAFDASGFHNLLQQVVSQEPVSPKAIDPNLPVELDTIIRKGIAKAPDERYESAQAFADDLQRWLDDKPIAARPPNLLERAAKWRRRNNGLVAAIGAVLFVVSLCLLLTVVVVWNEQRQTAKALQAETDQRLKAELAFNQAKTVVDTFSQLSERELAARPDMTSLRRTFLETSLEYYRKFLEENADNPRFSSNLERTSKRVESLIVLLRNLESVEAFFLLVREDVLEELEIESERREQISQQIGDLFYRKAGKENNYLVNSDPDGVPMAELQSVIADIEAFASTELQDKQIARLRQISRQERLPFTFKTAEIVQQLELTEKQQENIQQIIFDNRPLPKDFHENGPKDGRRGRGGRGGPPPRDSGPPFNRPGPDDPFRSHTEKTVAEILDILTDQQKATWKRLIGPKFGR